MSVFTSKYNKKEQEEWYDILEFNVPLDTVQVISETEGL